MTIREIIEVVRNILDDANASLWSDKELVTYTEKAIRDLCKKAAVLIDSSTTDICQVSVVDGTKDYIIDKRILEIRRARLTSQTMPLKKKSAQYFEMFKPTWESDSTGTPLYYLTDHTTGYITLHPTPVSDDILKLTVVRLPLEHLSVDDMDVEPEITEKYHDELYEGILSYAYSKQDADTFDARKSATAKALWMQKIQEIANDIAIENSVDTNLNPLPDYMDNYPQVYQ